MIRRLWVVPVAGLVMLGLLTACQTATTTTAATPTTAPTTTAIPTPKPTPTLTPTPTQVYSLPELEYRLLARYDNFFWCDPDFYPVGRPGQEEKNAQYQFPAIQSNQAEFTAILAHLGLPNKTDYMPDEKLSVYREHKKLTYALQVTPSGDLYSFTLRVGQGQGFRIDGTMTRSGVIAESARVTSFNTCPICLTEGTIIDTPSGPVPVEKLRTGMMVWTFDESGNRVAGLVLQTAPTPVPPGFQVIRLTLSDGRTVTASPGHPTAEGRPLSAYQPGDALDGAVVATSEYLEHHGGSTYDLLPSGNTGLYRANEILLQSTLYR